MSNGQLIVPSEFPVVVQNSFIMPLPGIGIIRFLKHPYYNSLIQEAREGKVPFVFAVMQKQGYNIFPEKEDGLYQTGVVCSVEFVDGVESRITLFGRYRAKAGRIKKLNNLWVATSLERVIDKSEKQFVNEKDDLVINPEYRTSLLGLFFNMRNKIQHLCQECIEFAGPNDLDTQELLNLYDDFYNHDFNSRDAIDMLIWEIVFGAPVIDPPQKQRFIEQTFLMRRIGACLGLLELNLGIIGSAKMYNTAVKSRLKKDKNQVKVGVPGSGGLPDDDNSAANANPELAKRLEIYKKIKDSISLEAQKAILEDFSRLNSCVSGQSEWNTFINHLDCLLNLYSTETTSQENDISKVEEILGRSHYGLEDIKERIYDYLATKIRNPKGKAPILCFVGPPGVGKTSIGKSVAESLDLKFVRLSLGGIRDEADVRGHRQTYIGAIPGKIIQEIVRLGVRNPVFMLDEVDKINSDFRGDPSSALLEVLDPEQNHSFQDHYVGAPFDLSDVLFLCTANLGSKIQRALLDRMSIINVSGYTEEEKIEIARRFLIPDLVKEVALSQDNTQIEWQGSLDEVVSYIVSGYTKEAGVRKLKQKIQQILESLGRKYMKAETKPNSILITTDVVGEILKMPQYTRERISATAAGEAIGLAWTEFGGETIYVHAQWTIRSQGDTSLSQTGSSGDVMFKSNKTALTVAKNLAEKFNPKALKKFETHMLHLQANDASTPTDGPSATITMAMAIYSELIGKPIKPFIALSGELTPKGKILAVGGIKEKVLAANRDGIKELVLPKNNQRNVVEGVPEAIQRTIQFHYVNYAEEVIPIAFPESTPAQDP